MINNQIVDDKALFIKIQTQLEKADEVIETQNWEEANKLLKQTLDELGIRYLYGNLRDDTGYKLTTEADIPEREGRLDVAVRARRRILASRLEILRRKMVYDQPVKDDKTLLIEIQTLLEKADAEIETKNWKLADDLLKQALAELSDRYLSFNMREDSGIRLVEAMIYEEEGKLGDAVQKRRIAVAERLEMLIKKIQ